MTNAELINKLKILRGAILNPNHRTGEYVDKRFADVVSDAADALEATEQRIAELEAQLPKWTMLKDEMPNPHTKVLVSGIEAINNTRVYKVMVNDNGTLRPTDYAPSIMWDCWMPFGSPSCGTRMAKGEQE